MRKPDVIVLGEMFTKRQAKYRRANFQAADGQIDPQSVSFFIILVMT